MGGKHCLAVDIGGTNVRCALVNEYGRISELLREQTPRSRETLLDLLITLLKQVHQTANERSIEVIGIGVSSGGQINFKEGTIVHATDLIADWQNVPLKLILEKELKIPVFVDNDGHCTALAEKVLGRGKEVSSFVCLNLGTGIGGGVYLGGNDIWRGACNMAGLLGHATVDITGPVCSCGLIGCVELYCSGSGVLREYIERCKEESYFPKHDISSCEEVALLAKAGDQIAANTLRKAANALALYLSSLCHILNPERIILCGSLLKLGASFLEDIEQQFRDTCIPPILKSCQLVYSYLEEPSLSGAALLAFLNAPIKDP